MSHALIVYSPPPLLSFSERMLLRGMAQCEASTTSLRDAYLNAITRSLIRSMGIPSRLFVESTSYSSSRLDQEWFHGLTFSQETNHHGK